MRLGATEGDEDGDLDGSADGFSDIVELSAPGTVLVFPYRMKSKLREGLFSGLALGCEVGDPDGLVVGFIDG